VTTIVIRSIQGADECGEFNVDAEQLLGYARKQATAFKLAPDVALLEWLNGHGSDESTCIPDELVDRASYALPELLDTPGACSVFCRMCNEEVALAAIIREEWDDSYNTNGIRTGASGYTLACDRGHSLIHICTRMY